MAARLRPAAPRTRRSGTIWPLGPGPLNSLTVSDVVVAAFSAADVSISISVLVGTATVPLAGVTIAVVTAPARRRLRVAVAPALTRVAPLPTRLVLGTPA